MIYMCKDTLFFSFQQIKREKNHLLAIYSSKRIEKSYYLLSFTLIYTILQNINKLFFISIYRTIKNIQGKIIKDILNTLS